jgi:hypothetical protein
VLGSSREPLNYAESFGWQSVFAHKKTALAISTGLCGLLFCTLLVTKTYCTSIERDNNGSFMEMQGISLSKYDALVDALRWLRLRGGSGGNLCFTKAGIAGRQRAGMSLVSLKSWGLTRRRPSYGKSYTQARRYGTDLDQ